MLNLDEPLETDTQQSDVVVIHSHLFHQKKVAGLLYSFLKGSADVLLTDQNGIGYKLSRKGEFISFSFVTAKGVGGTWSKDKPQPKPKTEEEQVTLIQSTRRKDIEL